MIEVSSLSVGLLLLIAGLTIFVSCLPRGGRVNPLLIGSELVQSALMMALALTFFLGAALVLFGFPVGIVAGK